jgi:hypothetical protein
VPPVLHRELVAGTDSDVLLLFFGTVTAGVLYGLRTHAFLYSYN